MDCLCTKCFEPLDMAQIENEFDDTCDSCYLKWLLKEVDRLRETLCFREFELRNLKEKLEFDKSV